MNVADLKGKVDLVTGSGSGISPNRAEIQAVHNDLEKTVRAQGRSLTGYHTIRDDILNAGGIWEDREVVEDNNWVTSRQPSDIQAFNQAMIELFSHARQPAQAT